MTETTETKTNPDVGGQVEPVVRPEFCQGIGPDGAVFFMMNELPLSTTEVLKRLNNGANAERIISEMWSMFYGQNLKVSNWHLNGSLEPIDTFFEENNWSIDEA